MKEYNRIEELMLEASFEQLSLVDQAWVGQHLTELEFNEQRAILLEYMTELNEMPLLPATINSDLKAAFRQEHTSTKSFYPVLVKSIMTMAAMTLFFMLGRWSSDPSSVPAVEEPKVSIVKVVELDTVFQDRIKLVSQPIIKEKLIRDTIYITKVVDAVQDDILALGEAEAMPIKESMDLEEESSAVDENEDIYDILVDVY